MPDYTQDEKYNTWYAWRSCLLETDVNSVIMRIRDICRNMIVFIILTTIRKLDREVNPCQQPSSRAFDYFVDEHFYTSQLTLLRSMVDSASFDGQRGVYSLRSVIGNMRKHLLGFTREDYFQFNGLTYSIEKAAQLHNEFVQNNHFLFIPNYTDWEKTEVAHNAFDVLAECDHGMGLKTDQINFEIFEKLELLLKPVDELKVYVDKYIAHSATPFSRETIIDKMGVITLQKILECQIRVLKAYNALSQLFFLEQGIFIPMEVDIYPTQYRWPFMLEEQRELVITAVKSYQDRINLIEELPFDAEYFTDVSLGIQLP